MGTAGPGTLMPPQATLVQVDDDPAALGLHRPVHLGVPGDVAETARAVADALGGSPGATGYRSPEVRRRIAGQGRWRDVTYKDESDGERIDPRTLSIALDDLLPAERTVAVGSGNFMGYPSMFPAVPDDAGFCFTPAIHSLALAPATAGWAALS